MEESQKKYPRLKTIVDHESILFRRHEPRSGARLGVNTVNIGRSVKKGQMGRMRQPVSKQHIRPHWQMQNISNEKKINYIEGKSKRPIFSNRLAASCDAINSTSCRSTDRPSRNLAVDRGWGLQQKPCLTTPLWFPTLRPRAEVRNCTVENLFFF